VHLRQGLDTGGEGRVCRAAAMTDVGYQGSSYQYNGFHAWAVRPGDVAAVPEPVPAGLFGVGLAGLMLAWRRSSAARA